MKRLALGSPMNIGDNAWMIRALKTIEQATYEDIETIFDEYTVSGTITTSRTFDASTASATDLRNVLATLINDIQKRGSKRNPDEA